MNRAIVSLSLIVLLSGCAGEQLVTRRFQSMVWDTSPPQELINLHVIAFDPPSTAPIAEPAILSLSDRGQASYIDTLKKFEDLKNQDDLLQLLAEPFPKEPKDTVFDRTTIKKVILFSVMKHDALLFAADDPITEADRIAKIELRLTCGDNWYRLQSWDKLGTVYGSIDLGKVMRESSGSFNAKLSPTLSGTIIGTGEIGGGTSTKINEELVLKARSIDVSGTLTPTEGVIIQQGALGRDLEGNVSVILSVKMDGSIVNLMKMGQLFDDKGDPKKPEDVVPKIIETRIPHRYENVNGVELEVSADYLFRHVTEGKESVIEGDDVVRQYKGKVTRQEPLILLGQADYIKQSTYYLIKETTDKPDKELVYIKSDTNMYNLAFADRDEWDKFKKWMEMLKGEQSPVHLGKGANSWILIFKGRELKQGDVNLLGAFPDFRAGKRDD